MTQSDNPPQKLVLGILGSGNGSNFQAIYDAIEDGSLEAEIGVVIADKEDAGILERADHVDLDVAVIKPAGDSARLDIATEERIVERLREAKVNLVVLAGYMRILTGPMLEAFPGRLINIHPSLLPKYPGREAWKQALEAGDKLTGCTVHYVTKEVDAGPIIAQGEVDIFEDDTAETLHNRIQRAEHILYPMVLGYFAKGAL